MDFLAKALERRKQKKLSMPKDEDVVTWDDEGEDSQDESSLKAKATSAKDESSDVDTIVSKVIEKLREAGVDVKGEGTSKLIQDFSKEYGETKSKPQNSPREEYETPEPTDTGDDDYGSSEGSSDDETPESRLADALSDDEGSDFSNARSKYQPQGIGDVSEETMRVIREGLDSQIVDDIKRKGGKPRGLFERTQKLMAKKLGKY